MTVAKAVAMRRRNGGPNSRLIQTFLREGMSISRWLVAWTCQSTPLLACLRCLLLPIDLCGKLGGLSVRFPEWHC